MPWEGSKRPGIRGLESAIWAQAPLATEPPSERGLADSPCLETRLMARRLS